jgi:hypothetical protein
VSALRQYVYGAYDTRDAALETYTDGTPPEGGALVGVVKAVYTSGAERSRSVASSPSGSTNFTVAVSDHDLK